MLGTSPEMRGGVAAVVAVLRDSGLFARARVQYVVTHVDGGRLRKLRKFIGALLQVIRVLMAGQVAVVHAHVSASGSFWRKAILLWVARRFRLGTIFHLHDGNFERYAESGFGGPVLRWCIRRTLEASDVVIVLSERSARWMQEFSPSCRVRVIGNPVRLPARHRRVCDRDKDGEVVGRILFLGMICEAKGSFDLLRAFAVFRARVSGWRLVIGGHGEVDRFLEDAAHIGVRTDIDFLGWISGPDKERALSSADIFVLPSYSEGMPVSLLEAMAYGSAVVATPVGGVPDMMRPNLHGLWVDPGNVDDLAATLERLARSPDLRASLGDAARQHVLANYSSKPQWPRLSRPTVTRF